MELLKVKKKYKYIDDERQTELMVQLKNSTSIADVEHSFNALYDNMTKLLWNNLTRKYVPPLNHDDMKDVFQDSWVKVIDSRLMFDDSKKAYTWIFTIFKNMIIDRIRFFDRKKTQSMDTQLDDEGFTREFKADDKTEFRPSNSLAQIKSTLSESQKFHQYYNGGAKLLSVAHGSGGSGGGGISFTGSSGDSSNIGINIYPNPANDYLYIVFQDNSPRNIKLFNFQGVLIKNLTPKSNILDIDVTLLPNGIYHLEIHQGAEKIIEKIIVQH